MKIAIDAREYSTSTGRYIRKLIENLEQLEPEHEFVILLLPKDFDAYQPGAPNFSKIKAPYKEFTFSEQLGFLRLCRNLKADLIHFPMIQQPILYTGKVVTTPNDLTTVRFRNPHTRPLVFFTKLQVYKFVIHTVARKSKALLTYSQFVKQDIVEYTGVSPEKITVTLLSADKISVPAEEFKPLKNKPFIMYVGRALPHKNLRRLIDAFSLLQKDNPELRLVLVGKKDDQLERHIAYAKNNSIKNIVITGYVSEGHLRWLYENTACYCFPSLSEGFGLPSLEAMAHGAPVASSNATCLPEVNGDAAHYFNPLDVNDIAEKINDVLTDDKLRSGLIKKGSEQVKKYSWRRMAEQTLDVYNKCLGSGD